MDYSFRDAISRINQALETLDSNGTVENGIAVSSAVLSLVTSESTQEPSVVIDSRLINLPNSERQDHWFHQHPWMRGERAAFELMDSNAVPLQAKFYWLQKKSTSFVAGSVHFTKNWEDYGFTRTDEFKVGVDFFLSPDCSAVLVALSNHGKLRVLEISGRLTNTQLEIFEKWHNFQDTSERTILHAALWESFKLQSVNSSFYAGVSDAFNDLVIHLKREGRDEEECKLFASRLLGRLIFVWFLRKMDMVSEDIDYFNANHDDPGSYYRSKLERLFFRTLNTPVGDRSKEASGTIDLVTPYLNGGLFSPREDDWVEDETLSFPVGFFENLFEHFDSFNFTTDESTPEYEQVAIDPEMLGRVFESLLASQVESTGEQARKAKGAFYTPREIVSYMCKESLRSYLTKEKKDDIRLQKGVDKLLDTSDQDWAIAGTNSLRDIPEDLRTYLSDSLSKLTTLDPACGSGAFPLAMLQLLAKLKLRLEPGLEPYSLKLSILQKNIFGADIEPMAVEISRLRSWLSLIVEEKSLQSVEPLPNLEFNFVCANTLIPLDTGELNLGLFHDFQLTEGLEKIREQYFSETQVEAKNKLRQQYLALTQAGDKRLDDPRTSQLRSYNPFSNDSPADFFDPETMFGVSDGFDLVLGNPPYVDYRKIDSITKSTIRDYRLASHSKMVNLYTYFFELGIKLLSQGGILAFISPQQYLIYPNCKGLRDIIRESNVVLLADFARVKVFDASTYTFVTLLSKGIQGKDGVYKEFDDMHSFSNPNRTMQIPNPITEPVNISEFQSILEKIESRADALLGEVAGIFCASSSTKIRISSTEEIGPKFLTASDIFEWNLREPQKTVDVDSYGSISAKKQEGPVIYTTRMTKSIRAVVVDDLNILGGKVNVVVPHDLDQIWGLLGQLNSKLVTFWYREKYSMQHMQGGALPINTVELADVPVILNHFFSEEVIGISRSLQSAEGAQFEELRDQLETLVYKMYELTPQEIENLEKRYGQYDV